MVLVVALHTHKLYCTFHQDREYTYAYALKGRKASEPACHRHTHHLTRSATCNSSRVQVIHDAYAYAYACVLDHVHDYDCVHARVCVRAHARAHVHDQALVHAYKGLDCYFDHDCDHDCQHAHAYSLHHPGRDQLAARVL